MKSGKIACILLCIILFVSVVNAAEFHAMVAPSLMDSNMDGWYKIPQNSGPKIRIVDRVFQDQAFNLLILFRGYSADKKNNLHITYDLQVYDPQGNPTDAKGSNILAYQGPNPNVLILSQEIAQIAFTEKDPVGTYKIKVTAYDKMGNKSFSSETPIKLIKFSLPKKFTSQKKANKWIMGYYNNPTPIKAIRGVQSLVQLDTKWLNNHLSILTFFKSIFSDNSFLLKNIAKQFDSFSVEDKKRFLLISALTGDFVLEPIIKKNKEKELQVFYNNAKKIKFPDIKGEINSPIQLDILWSEFLATGRYDPIRKIVSALKLKKFGGTLEKIKSGEIEKTKDTRRKAYLEATHGSAVWSLGSNCIQMPLVFKYCAFMYENEKLSDDIKDQLGSVLHIAQKEIKEKKASQHKP